MLLPAHSPEVPTSTSAKSFAVPLTTLWNRSFDRNRIRALASNGIREPHGPMSTSILERDLPCYERLHSHDQRNDGRGD